jgi:hypothetical protein
MEFYSAIRETSQMAPSGADGGDHEAGAEMPMPAARYNRGIFA